MICEAVFWYLCASEDGVQPNDSNAVDPEAQPITFNVTIDQWIDEDKQTDM